VSKWCTARRYEPDATCELKAKHDGMHRAEVGKPVAVDVDGMPTLVAQVVSW
jgi:hypothetical protein